MRTEPSEASRTICWRPSWNPRHPGVGLEHLLLTPGAADSVILAVDEDGGAFRLSYRLQWNPEWQLRRADLALVRDGCHRSLSLLSDGQGDWQDGNGRRLAHLTGCIDIDIWPTPFTNSFPLRRMPLSIGERRTFLMAWVDGTNLAVRAQAQAYTRLESALYLFESLDGSGFQAQLPVDADDIVLDYPALFQRVR